MEQVLTYFTFTPSAYKYTFTLTYLLTLAYLHTYVLAPSSVRTQRADVETHEVRRVVEGTIGLSSEMARAAIASSGSVESAIRMAGHDGAGAW